MTGFVTESKPHVDTALLHVEKEEEEGEEKEGVTKEVSQCAQHGSGSLLCCCLLLTSRRKTSLKIRERLTTPAASHLLHPYKNQAGTKGGHTYKVCKHIQRGPERLQARAVSCWLLGERFHAVCRP